MAMVKIKVAEAGPKALDWMVCTVEGRTEPEVVSNFRVAWHTWGNTHYSTSWEIGGPILHREIDTLRKRSKAEEAELARPNPNFKFKAEVFADIDGYHCAFGPTPLIAAMRCYVASKLGDEVEVPEELLT